MKWKSVEELVAIQQRQIELLTDIVVAWRGSQDPSKPIGYLDKQLSKLTNSVKYGIHDIEDDND